MQGKRPVVAPLRSLLLPLFGLLTLASRGQEYDIRHSGAIGDGKTDNTVAIQRAIDSCAQTGGKVYFPAGIFLSGTLVLKSHVTLHLSAKAVLLGQPAASFYPYQQSGIPFYGEEWAKQALLFCKNQEQVTIEGSGTIDGQGAAFVTNTLKKPDRYRNRPYLLWFAGSKDITVKDVHLRNSAFWMQHYLGCERVRIDGVQIWNHSNKNNDMVDIDGCKYVTIANIRGDSDDDGITIKSTSPLLSEYITITNCILSSHCNALKFGTESTGGYRNVVISNCVIKPSAQLTTIYGKPAGTSGISLEIADGGTMENISINNISIEGPEVPLFIRLGNRARKHVPTASDPPAGVLRNVTISDIVATSAGATACSFSGIARAPIENISLRNITIETNGGGTTADVLAPVEEKEEEYPEATMFGKLPAYGFYVRYAKDIRMTGIRLRYKGTEARPAVGIQSTKGFSLTELDVQTPPEAAASVVIGNSQQGTVSAVRNGYPVKKLVQQDRSTTSVTVIQ